MKISKTKKLNELFDDDAQMILNKGGKMDDLLGGRNLIGDPIKTFLTKIFAKIPILEKCVFHYDSDHFIVSNDNVISFIVRNSEWHLAVAFLFPEVDKTNFCILYQKRDYDGDITMPLSMSNIREEYCYVEDFLYKTSDEAIDILNNKFLPLMKYFGLDAYVENKNRYLAKLN